VHMELAHDCALTEPLRRLDYRPVGEAFAFTRPFDIVRSQSSSTETQMLSKSFVELERFNLGPADQKFKFHDQDKGSTGKP